MDTVAKFVVDNLLDQNIDTYFGVPGGPIINMFDAVLRTPGVTLIESKHETAALFEAIGYYKATGKVPVILVSAGPGITNCLTGIASAKALRVPLIVMCGDVSWEKHNHILLQNGGPEGIDIENTFAPHVDKVIRIKHSDSACQQIVDFIKTRKGNAPSIFVLPLYATNAQIKKPEIKPVILNQSRGLISFDVINKVNNLIDNAVKPLLVLGYGSYSCQDKVIELSSHLGIPFVTTPQAKGVVSEKHNLSLRHCGLAASKWIRKYIEDKPDVVLVLGTDLDDCAVGITEFIGEKTQVIHVDLNPNVFNRKYKTTLGIVADIKDFADLMLSQKSKPFRHDLIKDIKKENPFDVDMFYMDGSVPITPHRALGDLENNSPYGARFVTDIGEHMLFCLHYLTIGSNDFSIDLGLGSMGSGICQSIGMCLADKKPTIVVCGDGGMQMHGMEILTAIRHNLPMVFAVFNDARYNMVYHGFKFSFGREEHLGQTDYIDFVKFAESLGIEGYLIEKPGQITNQLIHNAFQSKRPVILDIRIDKSVRIAGAGRVEVLKTMGES